MTTPDISPFSPAAALTDFLYETQAVGIRTYENILLMTKWHGQEWASAQEKLLAEQATTNGMLVAKTADWMSEQHILPYVLAGDTIGTIDSIGTDSKNVYELVATMKGRRRPFAIGNIALIDSVGKQPSAPHLNVLGVRRPSRPTLQLGDLLFPGAQLPYGSAI